MRTPDQRTAKTARPLLTLLDANLKIDGHRAVVWIDDAHEHFAYGLTLANLTRLCSRYPGLVVAMTLHTEHLVDKRRDGGELTAVDTALIGHLRDLAHELDVKFDHTEQASARELYPYLEAAIGDRADFEKLPAWFAGVPYLQARYRDGAGAQPGGVAIAKAAIDWRRAGMPAGMTSEQLRALADIEYDQITGVYGFSDDTYGEALAWATGEDPASHPRWRGVATVRPVPGGRGTLWRDFDAITAWAPTVDPKVSADSWDYVFNQLAQAPTAALSLDPPIDLS